MPKSTAYERELEQQLEKTLIGAFKARASNPSGFDEFVRYLYLLESCQCYLQKLDREFVSHNSELVNLAISVNAAEPLIKGGYIKPVAVSGMHRLFHGKHCDNKYHYYVQFVDGTYLRFRDLRNPRKLDKYRWQFDDKLGTLRCEEYDAGFLHSDNIESNEEEVPAMTVKESKEAAGPSRRRRHRR